MGGELIMSGFSGEELQEESGKVLKMVQSAITVYLEDADARGVSSSLGHNAVVATMWRAFTFGIAALGKDVGNRYIGACLVSLGDILKEAELILEEEEKKAEKES
jgi:hypothetical protein